jgi:uncharacterized membrane protein
VEGGIMDIEVRELALIIIYASLYAVMVWVFAPFSFYALQFRLAGVLRPAIAKKWTLSLGYAMGVVVGNLISPFAGVYELLFMPVMSLVAGVLGYQIGKRFGESYLVTGMVIATVISFSVGWMLNQLFNIPLVVTVPGIFVSEQVVCMIGSYIFRMIESRYEWW